MRCTGETNNLSLTATPALGGEPSTTMASARLRGRRLRLATVVK